MTAPRPIQVIKVGGSILEDSTSYERIAGLLAREVRRLPTWVVVSAASGVTDVLAGAIAGGVQPPARDLIERHAALANALLPPGLADDLEAAGDRDARTRSDRLLSWGERASAWALQSRLEQQGVTVPLIELQEAIPLPDAPSALVPGFFFRSRSGEICCLPRGGGDISAVLVAAAVGATQIRLWKAGGGIRLGGRSIPEAASVALIPHLSDPLRPVHLSALWLADRWGIDLVLEDPRGGRASTRLRSSGRPTAAHGPPSRSALWLSEMPLARDDREPRTA